MPPKAKKPVPTVALGPENTLHAWLEDRGPAEAILDNLLEVMHGSVLFLPRSLDELFSVLDNFMKACAAARKFTSGGRGFVGGNDPKHMYLVKHCTRVVLLELSAILATRTPAGRVELSKPAEGDRPAPRRVTSSLAMRPEEMAAGCAISSLLFDVKLERIQGWCPLEEADLIEPFKHETGRWVYETFGVNPSLLGCVLCLASGIGDPQRAMRAAPADVLREIRKFYAETHRATGAARDCLFAPGARVLWQDVREASR